MMAKTETGDPRTDRKGRRKTYKRARHRKQCKPSSRWYRPRLPERTGGTDRPIVGQVSLFSGQQQRVHHRSLAAVNAPRVVVTVTRILCKI